MGNELDKLVAIKSPTLNDFVKALNDKIYENEDRVSEAINRQVILEKCVYGLLSHSKPTDKDYMHVVNNLFTIKEELRNPDLYNRACKRSNTTLLVEARSDTGETYLEKVKDYQL